MSQLEKSIELYGVCVQWVARKKQATRYIAQPRFNHVFFSESPNNTLPANHPRTPWHFLSAVFITFDYLAYPQKTPTANREKRTAPC
jgi:hypothetical protein